MVRAGAQEILELVLVHWWGRPGPEVSVHTLVGKDRSWDFWLQGPGWCVSLFVRGAGAQYLLRLVPSHW